MQGHGGLRLVGWLVGLTGRILRFAQNDTGRLPVDRVW
jgi:hypothetical protein